MTTKMITQTKKDFLKKISGGLHVLMATSYAADEIAVNPEDEIEEYIAKHLLDHEESAIGVERAWLSEQKFGNFIDTETDIRIKDILHHMDNLDMPLCRVFDEASMHPDDFTEEEKSFVEMINSEKMRTFSSFFLY